MIIFKKVQRGTMETEYDSQGTTTWNDRNYRASSDVDFGEGPFLWTVTIEDSHGLGGRYELEAHAQ